MRFVYNFINKNEIPGELWCEKMIPWHVKIMLSPQVKRSLLLWLHNALYLSLSSFRKISKKHQIEMVWYFIDQCLCNKQNITRQFGEKFPFECWKIFLFCCADTSEIFLNTWREISYLCAAMLHPLYMFNFNCNLVVHQK